MGTVESTRGDGYIAAMVVKRLGSGAGMAGEAFRDDSLACGYRWPSADDAIHYDLNRARQRIRQAFAFADLLPQGRESAFSLWWDSTTKHPRKADRHLPPAFLHGQ